MKKLILLILLNILPFGKAWLCFAQTSYTSKVSNSYASWGGQKTYKTGTISCAEYFSSSHFYNNAFWQVVNNLPVGIYTAEIYFNASTTSDVDKKVEDGTKGYTYLIAGDQEVDVPIYNVSSITDNPTLYTIENIHVTDGTLRLGSRNNREAANWHIIRLKSLKYYGTDSVSLYWGLFPLIRQGRDQWEKCTCLDYRTELDTWINKALQSNITDNTATLQETYNGLKKAISSSQTFESTKATKRKVLSTNLTNWQNTWNNGRTVTSEQWSILRPALVDAVLAKDLDCSYAEMGTAATALSEAMKEAADVTGINDIDANEDSKKGDYIGLDGTLITHPQKGHIYVKSGKKIITTE